MTKKQIKQFEKERKELVPEAIIGDGSFRLVKLFNWDNMEDPDRQLRILRDIADCKKVSEEDWNFITVEEPRRTYS